MCMYGSAYSGIGVCTDRPEPTVAHVHGVHGVHGHTCTCAYAYAYLTRSCAACWRSAKSMHMHTCVHAYMCICMPHQELRGLLAQCEVHAYAYVCTCIHVHMHASPGAARPVGAVRGGAGCGHRVATRARAGIHSTCAILLHMIYICFVNSSWFICYICFMYATYAMYGVFALVHATLTRFAASCAICVCYVLLQLVHATCSYVYGMHST